MSALPTDAQGVRLACPACGKVNRVPWQRTAEAGRCGACGETLPPIAAPFAIESSAGFDALVSGAVLPVLVDFWAPWCGPCVMVAPELEKVAASEAGRLLVAKVDTEAQPELGARHQIRSIPTMALFVRGTEVLRQAGALPAEGILQLVAKGLARPSP